MASSWQWNQVFRSSDTQAICARDTSGGGAKSLLQGSGTSGPDQGSGLVTANHLWPVLPSSPGPRSSR